MVFLGDKLSLRSAFGTFLVLFGTFLYSLVRSREMDLEKAKKKAQADEAFVNENSDAVGSDTKDTEVKPLLSRKEQ